MTDFNKKEAAIAFGFGAVGGALSPVMGPTAALLGNAFLGAAQEVTTDMAVDGKSFGESLDSETLLAAGFGMVGAKIQGSIPDELLYPISVDFGVATGKDALAYGGSWFAKNTTENLLYDQLGYMAGARFSMGATIGNVPVPDTSKAIGLTGELWREFWNANVNDDN